MSLIARSEVFFFVLFGLVNLVSSRRHIVELMVSGFGRPMQLLRGEVDRIRWLAVYVHDGFLTYRQRSYECGYLEVIVTRLSSSSNFFMRSAFTGIQIYRIEFFTDD